MRTGATASTTRRYAARRAQGAPAAYIHTCTYTHTCRRSRSRRRGCGCSTSLRTARCACTTACGTCSTSTCRKLFAPPDTHTHTNARTHAAAPPFCATHSLSRAARTILASSRGAAEADMRGRGAVQRGKAGAFRSKRPNAPTEQPNTRARKQTTTRRPRAFPPARPGVRRNARAGRSCAGAGTCAER